MLLFDDIQIGDLRTTREGYLVASRSRLSRTGIQVYPLSIPDLAAKYPGRPTTDSVRLYRPHDEVFAETSLDSLRGKPVTIEHPGEFIDSKNARRTIVGMVGDDVRQEGDHVVATVRVLTEDGVKAVGGGKQELSVGYDFELEVVSGTTPEGEAYDGIQRRIVANHVALVDRGRCGPSCRLQDGNQHTGPICRCQGEDMSDTKLKAIDCGGRQVEVTDAAAIAIENLIERHGETIKAKDTEIASKDAEIAARDKQLAERDSKIETLEAELKQAQDAATPEALDARVAARTKLIEDAHKLDPKLDCTKLSDGEIRSKALQAIDVDLDGKSDAYVEAAFDARVDAAESGVKSPANRTASALADAARKGSGDPIEAARQKAIDAKQGAWQRIPAGGA